MLTWDLVHSESGLWIWSTSLPNGWTAWVVDPNRELPTRYFMRVSSPGSLLGPKAPITDFVEAKRRAVDLALQQKPYIDRRHKISAEIRG